MHTNGRSAVVTDDARNLENHIELHAIGLAHYDARISACHRELVQLQREKHEFTQKMQRLAADMETASRRRYKVLA